MTIAGDRALLEQRQVQPAPIGRWPAHAASFGRIGLVAPGELARDRCIETIVEIAATAGRLPLCLDLHAWPPCDDACLQLDMVLISRRLAEPVSARHKRAADAILRARAPVLFVPQAPRTRMIGGRVLIVWDGSPSAAAALACAAPPLCRARRIMLVDAQMNGQPLDIAEAADFVRDLPGDPCLDVTALHLETPAVLMEAASLSRADYLVIGGFGDWDALPDILYGDCDSVFLRTSLPLLLGH